MGVALYRKYRSKKLSEIVGQEHITTTLANALKQGTVSHAYFFTGPRGVGKTSVARILAHEVNNLPYDEEATHIDIIEIDAASNRRIDEIRELREKVHTVPAMAKYKVYIIDEVHMLTREAFNALLKTLEEPPEHAIFILATTESHKVPETITSRTQRFTFRPIGIEQQVDHLRRIAAAEKAKVDNDALELIARHSGGSFRDSISLLDQARAATDHVTLEAVQSMLGIAPAEAIEGLADLAKNGKVAEILDYLGQMRYSGYQAPQLASQLGTYIRQQLPETPAGEQTRQLALLAKLLQVPAAHDPMSLLEIILMETSLANNPNQTSPPNQPTIKEHPQAVEKAAQTAVFVKAVTPKEAAERSQTSTGSATHRAYSTKSESEAVKNEEKEDAVATDSDQIEAPSKPTKTPETTDIGGLDSEMWQKVLQAIKSRHNTLYSIARMAQPTFNKGEIILGFKFAFHQKRFNEPKVRQLISDIVQEHTGQTITITCIVATPGTSVKKDTLPPPAPPDDILASISNIFGDAEVLE